MNDIVVFMIEPNVSVIGKLVGEDENILRVERPHIIIPSPNGIAMVDSFLSDEKVIIFNKDRLITYPTKPQKNLEAEYIKKVSGIVIPEGKILKGKK